MKHLVPVVLAAAVLAMPVGALAGETSAPGFHGMGMMFPNLNLSDSQRQAIGQIMSQSRQQMDQLHEQGRERILASLSPAHRALLAQVVGSLATAPNPDESAAIHELDSALSPGEAQNIVSLHSGMMQQGMSIMQATHEKMLGVLTDQQRTQLQSQGSDHFYVYNGTPGSGGPVGPGGPGPMGGGHMHSMHQMTAGAILLHLSDMHGDGPVIFMHAQTQP
jgi:Spy/CpxP family protein refolding chaperone